MSQRSLGRLTLDIVARVGGFTQGMSQAERVAQDKTRKIERSFSTLGATITKTFALIGGSAAIVAAAKNAVQLGDDLDKAATKAGITGSAMSELAHAAKMTDVDLGGLSTALRVMQKNLSEAETGAKGPREALAALGLELSAIEDLAADKQFEVLADRISRLREPADRTRAAVELFGRAGAELLPLFEQGAEGIRKAREEAHKFGTALSDEQIQNLAAVDESIKGLTSSFNGLALTLTSKLAPSLSYALQEWNQFLGGPQIENIRRLREQIRVLEESIDSGGGTFLTPFISMGALGGAPDVEAGIYSLEEQIAKVEELKEKLRSLETPYDDFAARRARAMQGSGAGEAPGFVAKVPDILEPIEAAGSRIERNALQELYAQWEKDTETSLQKIVADWEDFEGKISELVRLGVENGGITKEDGAERLQEYVDGILQEVEPAGKRLGDSLLKQFDRVNEFMLEAARSTQGILADTLFGAMEGKIDNIGKQFLTMLNQLIAQALAADLATKLFGADMKGGGWLDAAFQWGASLFGGGRAAGGPVAGGHLYRVNERGMEAVSIPGRSDYLMMGRQSGEVIPANRTGRAATVNQAIHVSGRPEQRTARQIAMETAAAQRMAVARLS